MSDYRVAGMRVYTRDGEEHGHTTGSNHECRMEGCNGLRISVRWSDGHHTFPCSKGLLPYKKDWRIG